MLFETKSVYILCIYTVKGAFCHFQASMLGVSLGYFWGMLGDVLDGASTGSRRGLENGSILAVYWPCELTLD